MKLTTKAMYVFSLIGALLAAGTVVYAYLEGWRYLDSFYFATMTLTTIGYGDFVPTTDVTKLFTAVYSLVGIGAVLYLFTSAVSGFYHRQEKYFEKIIGSIKKYRSNKNKKRKR